MAEMFLMMNNNSPKIKFFTNSRGESVAFAVHGRGPALVMPAWWISHLELDWQNKRYQRFFQQLGEHFTVVRYDRPGAGLSERNRQGFSLQDEVDTLSDLIEYLSLPTCTLLGVSCGGPTAILYARHNSERVKHLIFFGAYADGADICDLNIQESLRSLVLSFWGLGAKAILDLFDPDMNSHHRKELGKVHKDSASSEMAESLLKLSFSMDAREAASLLHIPALVIHRSKDNTVPFNAGRKLASILPNAQLVSVSGNAHLPWLGENSDDIVKEIIHFAGESSSRISVEAQEHHQFRQIGDVWTLSYADKTVHLKDSRGIQDIALLISNKNNEIHVADLIGGEQSPPIEAESVVLDEAAICNYKERLQEINEDKQKAAASGEERYYETLEQEEEAIIQSLKQGVGLGGRQRQFSNNSEKARKAVAARIRAAIKKIESVHPELGEHLHSSLRTGYFCSYTPSEEVTWLS